MIDFQGSWEKNLPLVEFAYNNSYQATIGMAPYEALYGRPCRTPICWAEPEDSILVGPDLVRDTTKKVAIIRERIIAAQSRQKSYAYQRRRPLEFVVGDFVLLKSLANEGCSEVWEEREVGTTLRGTIQDYRADHSSIIQTRATAVLEQCS